jgi:hypothetical protein
VTGSNAADTISIATPVQFNRLYLPVDKLPPEYLDHINEQVRDYQARLDPDGAPTAHPWRVAARNSAIAVGSMGAAAVVRLHAYRSLFGTIAWWVWLSLGALTVAVCFGHAALGLAVGRRASANVFRVALFLLLVGMIVWVKHQLGDRGR